MKITVVIPVLNGERYIAQCLENVLCQTHRDLQIIVVDDGSTDSTAAIAARYPSVKVISQPNGGISVARNAGLDAATGDYIHFLDVDDLLNREYYERMVAAIGSGTGAAPVDMVYGGYVNGILPDTSIRYTERLLLTLLDDKIRFTNSLRLEVPHPAGVHRGERAAFRAGETDRGCPLHAPGAGAVGRRRHGTGRHLPLHETGRVDHQHPRQGTCAQA